MKVEAGAYFKEGDILTSTKGCQFIYDGLITEGAIGSICGMTTYGDIEFDRCTLWTDVYSEDKNRNVRKAIEEEKKFLAEKIIKAEDGRKINIIKRYLSEYEYLVPSRKDGLYLIYGNGHAEPFTGDNSKDCVQYIGLKHRYMSFAISLTEHDIVQLLDDDSREESGSGTYYERECDALFDIDGRGNTERLVARNPKLRNLLEDGEYIPSLGQLNLMAHYMDELNKAFAYVSASPLSSTWYWSSTESSQAVAWYVVFSSGLTGTGNKHIGDMVRTVIDF